MDAFLHSPSEMGGRFIFGTYEGDYTAERVINLGFTPSAVLVVNTYQGIGSSSLKFGGFATQTCPADYADRPLITIVTDGFKVYYGGNSSSYQQINAKNGYFNYIAWE